MKVSRHPMHSDLQPSQPAPNSSIERTLIRVASHTDNKDWQGLQSHFTDEVLIHAVAGEPAIRIRVEQLPVYASFAYKDLETSHTLIRYHVQFKGKACDVASVASCWRTARHRKGEAPQLVYTHCHHSLLRTEQGWRVSQFTMPRIETELTHTAAA